MFETFIGDTQTFLKTLAQNNKRDWFLAHKAEYETKLRTPALAILEEMSPRLSVLTGYPITTKLFRANRDVRFSKDKTPYHTHLYMMWMVETGTRQNPAFYFGTELETVGIGTGMREFTKDVLMDWRKMADLDGSYLSSRIKILESKGYAIREPVLKRAPPPFPKDHPYGDLLRHKGLVAFGHPTSTGDLITQLESAFTDLWPLSDMLIGVAETPTL
ncbi:TIGR02453 family protein [Octadecabacter ascidiaceicola]|uniref:TIGR02453 family protein n=1 Tax=Octadecabacter ascidiaceicola TaxID=1655543 RepID=A0A238K3R6_9RHOB|nr:TIGR02453 family protein [Octadecabacter ascidiaceicola]SMX37558.1 hypothetical protein OCA8868_01488 [Octadecabacter ascidiaceicola]